jgi:hypothetical protein
MRPRKHNLRFLVGAELLPHTFVNIPDKKMPMGVFIFIIFFLFLKCITWNFDGSNFVSDRDKDEDLKMLRFENGDVIPNIESYFIKKYL